MHSTALLFSAALALVPACSPASTEAPPAQSAEAVTSTAPAAVSPTAAEPAATPSDPAGAAAGAVCGTRGAPPCGPGLFCGYEPGANCGRADAPGKCKAPTQICTKDYRPVCGCDGKTYSNACAAGGASVGIDHDGACK